MSNFNFNKSVLGGRLTADVELKQTQNGVPVCSFTLAVARKMNREETDFINCTAWRGTAEFISKYFKKGSALCVVGAIQTRSWTDQNGQKRYATEVVVDEALFVDSKNGAEQTETASPNNYIPTTYNVPETPNFEGVGRDDSDLPF